MIEYILILLLILAILIGIVTIVLYNKNKNKEPSKEIDYRTFYILGISFLPMGIVLSITTKNPGMIGIMGLGAAYLAIGLANRDKWKNEG
jgi:hypothetical protein